jgi:hypothetical protein
MALVGSSPPAISQAEQVRYDFNVPSEELTLALRDFGRATGLQFVRFSEPKETDILVNAVTGSYTVEQGLDALLKGTGLQYRFVNSRTIAIVKAPPKKPDKTASGEFSSAPAGSTTEIGSPSSMNKRTTILTRVAAFLAGCAALVDASSVCAQEADVAKATLEEVVVTATKRTERLEDIPVAAQVVSAEALAAADVADLSDLNKLVPSVELNGTINGRVPMGIRGISSVSSEGTVGISSGVAIMVDGVPVPSASCLRPCKPG